MTRSRIQTLALALTAATAVAGCTLNRSAVRKNGDSFLGQVGGAKVIEPKRCVLSVIILPKPMGDPAVNSAVWAAADEQTVPPEARRALEANGLRVGVLTGGLPAEVEAAVAAPPPNKVDPAEFNVPDGSNTLISLAESRPSATLLLNRDGHAGGKDYKDASGWFRVTAAQDGPAGVSLRFVPEVHHGPMSRRFDAVPNNTGPYAAMQFGVKDGQQEETFREILATLTLQPGQVAVIGCLPDRPGSLGAFLFTQPEANSDRLLQKLLIVRASRTNVGEPGSRPAPATRLEPFEPADLPLGSKPAEPAKPGTTSATAVRPKDEPKAVAPAPAG